jgi:ribulose kinase
VENDLNSLVALYIAGICSIGYGLRQIIEAQATAGAPIERVVISGGAGRLDLVRLLLADATGKPVLATQAEEPVLLGATMLGGVAGGLFDEVRSAMARMSQISKIYEPAAGTIAALHEARFRAFRQLQSVAREIRQTRRDAGAAMSIIQTVAFEMDGATQHDERVVGVPCGSRRAPRSFHSVIQTRAFEVHLDTNETSRQAIFG